MDVSVREAVVYITGSLTFLVQHITHQINNISRYCRINALYHHNIYLYIEYCLVLERYILS